MAKRHIAYAYAAAILTVFSQSAVLGQEPLKKATIIQPNQTRSQEPPAIYLPRAFGWWKEEGYDVEIVAAAGAASVAQLLIGGRADGGMLNSSAVINAHVQGFQDIKIAAIVTNTIWRLGALPSSGITSPAQLRGKTIGLMAIAAGGDSYLDELLRRHGVDPKDVKRVAVGRGATAEEALRSGTIQALFTIDADLDRFGERHGTKLEIFYEPEWLDFPDFGLSVTTTAMKRDPKLAEAIARGIAKAYIVQLTNPECVSKVYHALNGDTGRGTIEAMTAQNSLYAKTLKLAFDKGDGKNIGAVNANGLEKLQQFLLRTGSIPRTVQTANLVLDPEDGDFARRVNTFDRAKVEADARECTALKNIGSK